MSESVEDIEKTEEVSGVTEGASEAGASAGRKKKPKRLIHDVIVHIYASFNNTIATVTDMKGHTLAWATAGGCGFRGSRKSTPFAGQVATSKAVQKVREQYGAKTAEIRVFGPGPGRDASVRAVREHLQISAIYDVTGIPFNGCRPPKERRV